MTQAAVFTPLRAAGVLSSPSSRGLPRGGGVQVVEALPAPQVPPATRTAASSQAAAAAAACAATATATAASRLSPLAVAAAAVAAAAADGSHGRSAPASHGPAPCGSAPPVPSHAAQLAADAAGEPVAGGPNGDTPVVSGLLEAPHVAVLPAGPPPAVHQSGGRPSAALAHAAAPAASASRHAPSAGSPYAGVANRRVPDGPGGHGRPGGVAPPLQAPSRPPSTVRGPAEAQRTTAVAQTLVAM